MEKQNKWGGKRTGSGRKKKDVSKETIKISFTIDKANKEKLDSMIKMDKILGYDITRNSWLEGWIETDFNETFEELEEKKNNYFPVLNAIVDDFISNCFVSLKRASIPYNSYESLFNVRKKTEVEGGFITVIQKKYKEYVKWFFTDLNSKEIAYFKYKLYNLGDLEKRDMKRILRKIEKEFSGLFEKVYENDFNYRNWLLEFRDFCNSTRRSHIYDI